MGDSVVIDLMSANLEAALFGEDAEQFNPHRRVAERIPPFGLSFGIGIHRFLGATSPAAWAMPRLKVRHPTSAR